MIYSLSYASEATKMTAGDALLLSLIGVVLIVVVLMVLLGIVKLMSFVIAKITALKKKTETLIPASQSESVLTSNPTRTLTLKNVSEQDAALIMAIVANHTNVPIEELNFKSIKLLEEGE